MINHVAIIPDGNRRWAKAHLLLPWQGHYEGLKKFWELTLAAPTLGIKNLTFWGSSYSNLSKRSKKEVSVLFDIMRRELSSPDLLDKLIKNETRFRIIGEWEDFAPDTTLRESVDLIEKQTEHLTKHQLTVLFGYDGQREMLSTVKKLQKSGEEVTEQTIHKNLLTNQLPDVDLVIRTGGEPHWSAGFLMWQTANSQFYFTEMLWPDFGTEQLKTALDDYERRERRLGK